MPYPRERSLVVPSPSFLSPKLLEIWKSEGLCVCWTVLQRINTHRSRRRRHEIRATASHIYMVGTWTSCLASVNPCFDWKCYHPFFWHSTRNSNRGLSTWRSHLGLRLGSTSSSTRDVDGPRGCLACLQAPHLNNTFPSTHYAMFPHEGKQEA